MTGHRGGTTITGTMTRLCIGATTLRGLTGLSVGATAASGTLTGLCVRATTLGSLTGLSVGASATSGTLLRGDGVRRHTGTSVHTLLVLLRDVDGVTTPRAHYGMTFLLKAIGTSRGTERASGHHVRIDNSTDNGANGHHDEDNAKYSFSHMLFFSFIV